MRGIKAELAREVTTAAFEERDLSRECGSEAKAPQLSGLQPHF